MVGRKVAWELLEEDSERHKATYDGLVKRLKNKTRELSTLCDVPVLLISFGPTGTTCTWPEDREEVCALISKFRSCDTGSRKRGIRRQLGGSSDDLQVVARQDQKPARTSPQASSISADLLQDQWLEKTTLQEVMFLSISIDRASRMIEEKIKSLDHDHKCRLHGRELEILSSPGPQDHERSSSSSEKLTSNATEVVHHQIITYSDQVGVGMTISYVDNSMVQYPVIVANDIEQLDVMRGVTPPALPAPDSATVRERSTVGEIGATGLDRQIIPCNNSSSQQLDMQADDMGHCQVTIPAGQIESICSEAIAVASEPQVVMIMTPSHDHQVLSPCHHLEDLTMCAGVDPFMASSLVTHSQMTAHHPCMLVNPDHAGYNLQQEGFFNYSFPSTPQQLFFVDDEQQPEIDDICGWISQHDDMFFLW